MKLKFINYLFVLAFLFVSCDDTDDDASSEPLLGLYTISSSVLTSDAVSANGAATVASGTDITSTIVTSFLAEIQCQGSHQLNKKFLGRLFQAKELKLTPSSYLAV